MHHGAVILYQIILKQLSVTPTILLSFFSRRRGHTNLAILTDAR